MKPEWNKASAMLFRAGAPIKSADVNLLGADIRAVAVELSRASEATAANPDDYIALAARELERRIGGLVNLEAYLATLRAGMARFRA